ncbi:Uncharacterized protein BM_BM3072 [Brugia malayi]|uniref:C2 domain-containing protein n=1 Tax=Brugia malayi TaxID=6279 RepID=A0A4E9FI71_BRUMA|nr:Uncharacterized protein BM_BM3072 [Brugia malayi]VIO94550.1 Uncharacterized protein BM_BM3072 [Brugia malayi]
MTNIINGYILYRLMVDRNNKSSHQRRHSLMPLSEGQKAYHSQSPRRSLFEPFCLPVIQHVPIKQRLSSVGRDSSNADICSDLDPTLVASSNPYLYRRRRMSLLQTLRYQNRLLADSGVECHSQQSDRGSEAARGHRSSYSSPFPSLEAKDSRRSSSIIKLKNKTFAFFGKRSSKRSQTCDEQISSNGCTKYCQSNENDHPIYSSIDLSAKETRHGKSLSTNDSGHESQGRIVTDEESQDDRTGERCSERQETVAVIEQSSGIHSEARIGVGDQHKCPNLIRSSSCPQLGLHLLICHEICHRAASNRQEFVLVDDVDSEEDENSEMPVFENSFLTDKKRSNENVTSSTPTKSLQSSSCEATECIIENDEFRYAMKLHRDCSLIENGEKNNISEENSLSQQQQQKRNLQFTKKLQYLRLSNGYVTEQFAYVSPRSGRNSPMSRISAEIKKQEDKKEDKRSLSTESFFQSETGKEILDCYPEFDSLPSFYSDDEDDDDDNLSSLMLDHYLPPKYSFSSDGKDGSRRSSSLSSLITCSDTEHASSSVERQRNNKVGIVTQTDLSLVHISDQLSSYLNGLTLDSSTHDATFFTYQGMNFLAKHFFEYQSLNNRPHYAVQLHKLPPSQAGADQSASWAPKSMIKAGKNQAAPAARANRANTELKLGTHRYGRAARHEFREWGDKHGELKGEKLAPHKDALTKFLSNEENTPRNLFDCEFEERIFQTEPETLPELLARSNKADEIDLSLSCADTTPGTKYETEVLTILTYAPNVQFVTATVKKAKLLPFNNKPFARVMLFDKRRLLEQKQTTVTPTPVCSRCLTTDCARQKPPASSPPLSSLSADCSNATTLIIRRTDAIFSESFLFHVTPQMLDRCHIVIEMFDTDPADCSRGPIPIGHCVIGPMCPGAGCAHWLQMIRKTGLPICMWHRLFKS